MPNYRLTLEYDGAGFEGWQSQRAGVRTVQGVVEAALAAIAGSRVVLHGASRTDAGVHAEAQVASACFETRLAPAILARALDAKLPPDATVLRVEGAPEAFHARRDARWKLYRYAIWNGPARSPLRRGRWARCPEPLDLAAMGEAGRALVGRHDFSSFQNAAADWRAEGARRGLVRSPVRSLHRLEVCGEAGGEVWIEAVGDGFLRGMVRAIAGSLVQVGRGRRAASSMRAILDGRDRRLAGPSAPAAGLTLVRIGYAGDEEMHGKSGA